MELFHMEKSLHMTFSIFLIIISILTVMRKFTPLIFSKKRNTTSHYQKDVINPDRLLVRFINPGSLMDLLASKRSAQQTTLRTMRNSWAGPKYLNDRPEGRSSL